MSATWIVKAKCMRCSLHFTAYSFYESWEPQWCPECGPDSKFMVWKDRSDDEIFQFVPGDTPLTSLV